MDQIIWICMCSTKAEDIQVKLGAIENQDLLIKDMLQWEFIKQT